MRHYKHTSTRALLTQLAAVTLPEPEPVDIPAGLLALCDSVVSLDQPAPGLIRARTLKSPDATPQPDRMWLESGA